MLKNQLIVGGLRQASNGTWRAYRLPKLFCITNEGSRRSADM